jgi:hypothetical protein
MYNQQERAERPAQKPTLLLIICYFIIIKSGVKALMAFIFLVGGNAVSKLGGEEGFDTISGSGPWFKAYLIAAAALSTWAAIQLLDFKKKGLYVYAAITFISFAVPVYLGGANYRPSFTALTFSLIPISILAAKYADRLK